MCMFLEAIIFQSELEKTGYSQYKLFLEHTQKGRNKWTDIFAYDKLS